MKSCRSFWKASSAAALIFVASCQTTAESSRVAKAAGTMPSTSKSKAFLVGNKPTPQAFLSYYCRSGRPQRAYQYSVTAVAPRITGSMPIDLAAKVNGMMAATIRQSVRDLFDPNSPPVILDTNLPSLGLQEMLRPSAIANSSLQLKSSTSEIVIPGKSATPMLDLPMAFFASADGRQMFLGLKDAVPSKNVVISDQGPLRDLYDRFTMLVPFEAQKSIFPTIFSRFAVDEAAMRSQPPEMRKAMLAQYDQLARSSAVFMNQDETFNITAAIYQRIAMWKLYADEFTFAKEFQTEDPRVIKFQVGLDMNAVCAYARPVEDLQTH